MYEYRVEKCTEHSVEMYCGEMYRALSKTKFYKMACRNSCSMLTLCASSRRIIGRIYSQY